MPSLIETFRQAMQPWREVSLNQHALYKASLKPHHPQQEITAWVIALSGGCDSRLLLSLAAELRQTVLEDGGRAPALRALHIDHGIHPDSRRWAQQCQHWCEQLNVPLTVHRVSVKGHRQGLESLARKARYRVFEQEIQSGELLLMAHHRDDQAETLLLRLLRGAGVKGMAAMPEARVLGQGLLFRPLLALSRKAIEAEVRQRQLDWLDDPSNGDTAFDRNFLRHKLLPVFAERWPDASLRFSKAAELQAEAAELLQTYLEADLQALVMEDTSLDLASLAKFSEPRQRAVLRAFVQSHGVEPGREALLELLRQCFAEGDRQPEWRFKQRVFRRYQQRLYCVKDKSFSPVQVQRWPDLSQVLPLEMGVLSAEKGGCFLPKGEVSIAWREPGQRCQLAGETHSRSLKKLLQQWQVPQWQRGQVPLIFCDGELAAIADYAICEGFACEEGQGWRLSWQRATTT